MRDEAPRWWIGISVTIASNVLISLALNCQKLAHMRLEEEAQESSASPTHLDVPTEQTPLVDDAPRASYLRSKLWWTGFGLMGLGESGNFLSYGFAPASIVAPLGAVSLLSNVIIAPALLHESVHGLDLLGIMLAIMGAVAVVSSAGTSGSEPQDPEHLWAALARPTFLLYSAGMVCLGMALMVLCDTRIGKRSILAHVGVCAVFGGFTVLATKGISSFLVLTTGENSAWLLHEPLFYGLVGVLGATAVLQLAYLNRALQSFDSRHVIPTQFVLFTVSTIVGSSILYRDFAHMSQGRIVGFVAGVLTTFLGVFVLTCAPDTLADEEGDASPMPSTVEIVVESDAEQPAAEHAEDTSAPAQPLRPQGGRRRAYTAPSLDEAQPMQRPHQKLANMAAALVEQSQTYWRGSLPIPRRTRSAQRHDMRPSSSLPGLSDDEGAMLRVPSHAFLGISPGRNLLLIPSQGSPALLPLDLPPEVAVRRGRHRRHGSALASYFTATPHESS